MDILEKYAQQTPIHAPPAHRIDWRSPWTMFWVALLVRILHITIAHMYRIVPIDDHFQFGWEAGRIARALASGRGYADPFIPGTGPTAWLSPLFIFVMAAVFKVFGTYTAASAWVILSLDSVFSALIIPAIYEIAVRCYGTRMRGLQVARWAGWLWALHPAAMQYAVHWMWEMSLSTMLFSWMLVVTLRLRAAASLRLASLGLWIAFGLLWGAIALSNPSFLLFLPAAAVWILWYSKRRAMALLHAALAGVVFTLCVTPWVYRNWLAFHAFIPTRGNLGAELYAGNGPGSLGFAWGTIIPLAERAPDTILYKQLGEYRFVQMRGEMARAYIRTHRRHFAEISLKRFYFFWAGVPKPLDRHPAAEYLRELNFCFASIAGLLGLGLSLRHRIPAAGLFAWAFLLLPVTYYLVTPAARFRHPLEPLIDIFAVYLFQSAQLRRKLQPSRKSSHSRQDGV